MTANHGNAGETGGGKKPTKTGVMALTGGTQCGSFRVARYPGLIPVGSQKLSSHYEFIATTIRISADKVHIAVAKNGAFCK
jgi:hypothetical protein